MVRTRFVAWAMVLCFAGGAAAVAAEDVTMTGSFVWARQDKDVPGDIEAVFSPAGDNEWTIVFNFEWEGEMRHWKGEAKGQLDKGSLEGQAVEDRDRERTFVFKGQVEDGVFSGEHGSMKDGEMQVLGTITLKSP